MSILSFQSENFLFKTQFLKPALYMHKRINSNKIKSNIYWYIINSFILTQQNLKTRSKFFPLFIIHH